MRVPGRAGLRAAVQPVAAVVLAVAALGADGGTSWDAIRDAAAGVRTVRAEFVQEKRLPILSRPLRSEGALCFRRPDSIRWEYRTPVASVLVASGGEAHRFLRRDGQWVPESDAGMESMRVVLDEIARWLQGRFDEGTAFAATLHAGPPQTIELVPRDPTVARFVSRVVVTLADTPGAVAAIDIFEGEGGSTHIEFHDTELNVDLDDAAFAPPS